MQNLSQSNRSLAVMMDAWLFENKKFQVSDGTFHKLLKSANHYIYPYLGHMQIAEIKTEDIQSLITNVLFAQKNLSFSTVRKCKYLLKNFFDTCLQMGYIENNPVDKANDKTKRDKKDENILTVEQRSKLIEAISLDRFWKPFCMTVLNTGIKLNEMLPLKWQDIDFSNKAISINKYVAPVLVSNEKDSFNMKFGVQEYESLRLIRNIPLSDYAVEVLKEYKKYREREQKRVKNQYSYINDDDLVFGNEENKLRSYSGLSHNFRKFLKSQKLNDLNFTLHSLKTLYPKTEKATWNYHVESNTAKIYKNIYVKKLTKAKLKSKIQDFEM